MVIPFKFARTPHIIFGSGKRSELIAQVTKFGRSIILLTGARSFIKSPNWVELQSSLDEKGIKWHHHVIENEPTPSMIDEIALKYETGSVNAVVAIGGGSVLDAGKAVAAMAGKNESVKNYLEGVGDKTPDGSTLPFIALPTTAGTGSECTKNAVISEVGVKGFKKSLRHNNFVPEVAIVDPELTINCPRNVTAASGMDAFTQLLESYLSTNASPMTDALALGGLEKVRDDFEIVMEDGANLQAREGIAYAAMISGITLANAGLGTVHGFASSIGGRFEIPHGVVCGTLMAPCNRETVRKLRELGSSEVYLSKYARVGKMFSGQGHKTEAYQIDFLLDLINSWTDKYEISRLSTYGVEEKDIEALATSTGNKNNPVSFDKGELQHILKQRL